MINLYSHQKEAIEMLKRNNGKGYIALPPGLGKTLIASFFMKEVGAKRALILAPKSAFSAWSRELKKLEIPQERYRVVNYERFLSEFKKTNKIPYTDFLVLDEAHRTKNIRSQTTKLLFKYANFKMPKVLLSGTPYKDLIDLYSQFFIISPSIFGPWKSFTSEFFQKEKNPFGGLVYKPKIDAESRIFERVKNFFFRKTRDEIRELERIEVLEYFDTPDGASWEEFKKTVYTEILENNLGLFLSEEEFAKSVAEKIKGKFINMYKKAQMMNKDKHDYIKEFVSDNPDTIIFTFFVEEARHIANIINGYLITGNTPFEERQMIIKKQDKPIVFTQALSEGADLNNYKNLIFSTIPSSTILFDQVAGRIDRLSQNSNKITYIYLMDEYNEKMYMLLKERRSSFDFFSELAKSFLQLSKIN